VPCHHFARLPPLLLLQAISYLECQVVPFVTGVGWPSSQQQTEGTPAAAAEPESFSPYVSQAELEALDGDAVIEVRRAGTMCALLLLVVTGFCDVTSEGRAPVQCCCS
jgi:hypothetical protein